ncbi:ohospho-2-dehydro-3-deoxyheptonate aldolase 1, chloroplastic [Cymbomonas tetramitiformis]|uniref:Phospho-2-dehydro-3-deoxyheptonate aldolase n=1 Tax=Cymbomonas tetramitiformis TaxID=36881 RepID=A0AAE0CH70_9CHLO|nr:ohospho-2-dehydro-3-deoxyheptonate aldolase 1, chloroplastic [Cymbomonas tetramitiformis]KAK3276697.1 ohospho-2-dehydro-3-deoxyheptonate aldolase 1, chloroplastic [Cymbomonas tetramitiformis]|eukprot:gene9122-10810_t
MAMRMIQVAESSGRSVSDYERQTARLTKSTSTSSLRPRAATRNVRGSRKAPVHCVLAPKEGTGISEAESEDWGPGSWRNKEAMQQPTWPDQDKLEDCLDMIKKYPPLVFAGEAKTLKDRLADVCLGRGFLLQGGDCAESFAEFRADNIRDTFRVLLQMSNVLMYSSGLPVVKIGRMAGQFAKPRSADMEEIGGVSLPSYRGDNINSDEFTPEARIPNPERLLRAYNQSAATLNLLRGFSTGGYAALTRVTDWNLDFMEDTEQGARYRELANYLDEALQFMSACGMTAEHPIMRQTEFYTSHEALLLDYEQALTRVDTTTDKWYGCSAHFLWVGERTRQLDGAHLEYIRGINNPIGIKISNKCPPAELVELIETINPTNEPGKITVIIRMGAGNVREYLPGLVKAVSAAGQHVVWVSDPMHGNTVKSDSGYKTRPFESIREELRAFFDVHDELGTHPGGVHLEMTGQNVTECTGGMAEVEDSDLPLRYHTHCDPRLNAAQALELAFLIGNRLRKKKNCIKEMNGPCETE